MNEQAMKEGLAEKPSAVLSYWEDLKRRSAALVEEERALRRLIFDHFFPAPTEGTNTVALPDGSKVKGAYPLNREVEKELLEVLQTVRLRDLDQPTLVALHINPALYTGEELVLDVVRLNTNTLVTWKPSLAVKVYKALTAEQRLLFDRCVTTKPGSISLELVPAPTTEPAPTQA